MSVEHIYLWVILHQSGRERRGQVGKVVCGFRRVHARRHSGQFLCRLRKVAQSPNDEIVDAFGAAFILLGAEGYAADAYAKTPRGREESRRAKEEGAVLYRHAKETILRPGVLGGAVGLGEFYEYVTKFIYS